MQEHISQHVSFHNLKFPQVVPQLTYKRGEELLRVLSDVWQKHLIYVKWMAQFFQYLDRFYIKQNSKQNLNSLGMSTFNHAAFQPMIQPIIESIVAQINQEREENMIDISLMKNVVDIFNQLSSQQRALDRTEVDCKKALESQILESTRKYYRNQSNNLFDSSSFPEYLKLASKFLNNEKKRVEDYLIF